MANKIEMFPGQTILPEKYDEILDYLIDNISDGVAIFKPVYNKNNNPVDLVFSNINPIFEELTGLASEKVIGQRLTEILKKTGKDPPIWIKNLQECSLSNKTIEFNEHFQDYKKNVLVKICKINKNIFLILLKEIKNSSLSENISDAFHSLVEYNLVPFGRLRLSDLRPVYTNKASAELFGYSSQEQFIKEFHPSKHYFDPSDGKKIMEELKAKGYINNVKIHSKKKDGSPFWRLASYKIDNSGRYMNCTAYDITFMEELKREKLFNNILLENIYSAIIVTDLEYNIVKINQSAEKLYGWKNKEAIGKNMGQLIPTEYIDSSRESVLSYFNRYGYWKGNVIQKNRKNRKLFIESSVKMVKQDDIDIIIAINRDISKIKKFEEQNRRSIINLKKISDEKDLIAVNERRKLERELHDTVTQNIFAASIIAETLPDTWKKDIRQGNRQIKLIRQIIHQAYSQMRSILLSLHSERILEDDLLTSLKKLIDEYRKKTDIKISLKSGKCYDFRAEINKAIYRIVQESLANIDKHAVATEVTVYLNCSSKKFILSIRDNGIGFNIKSVRPKSLGIHIMKERASIINASLNIVTENKKGTEIIITNNGNLDSWLA